MVKYGLIGYPLSHSFSKKFFTEKFAEQHIADCVYDLYPIPHASEIVGLLTQNPELRGLNVTIPYKLDVMPYLNHIDEGAETVGAVNCIRISYKEVDKPYLEGFNTDIYGFEMSLKPLLKGHHTQALILGNGGAAKAVKFVLNKIGIPYTVVTRSLSTDSMMFDDLSVEDIKTHTLIINCTPLGTYPNVNECPPIPYEDLTPQHLLYDLIYNPAKTLFLKQGAENGAATKNGYEMLVLQAERSWEIWNAHAPNKALQHEG